MSTFRMKTVIVFILVVHASISWAEDANLFGVLPAISQTGRVTDVFDYNLFVSTAVNATDRTVDGRRFPARDLLSYFQPSLIYKYSPQLNFAVAYVYQRTNPFNNDSTNENRVFQQAIFSTPVLTGNLYQRVRFEERFITNAQTHETPFSTRLRYMVGYNLPLQGERLDPGEFYLNTYNEFFFSTSGQRNAVYSEDWLYGGIGYRTENAGNIEIGPLLQTSVIDTQGHRRNFFLLQVLWSTNFDIFR
ncbi:MAG TPA: DUF2490 domain-containing protein [Nitrosospira sp.]